MILGYNFFCTSLNIQEKDYSNLHLLSTRDFLTFWHICNVQDGTIPEGSFSQQNRHCGEYRLAADEPLIEPGYLAALLGDGQETRAAIAAELG